MPEEFFSITRGWRCRKSKRRQRVRGGLHSLKSLHLSMGFMVGLEVMWLPHLLRILREEEPEVEVTLCSQSSPELALALARGKLDIAFLRPEKQNGGVTFKLLAREPLIAVLPADHRLAARKKD